MREMNGRLSLITHIQSHISKKFEDIERDRGTDDSPKSYCFPTQENVVLLPGVIYHSQCGVICAWFFARFTLRFIILNLPSSEVCDLIVL